MAATVLLTEIARSAAANLGYSSLKPEQELAILSFMEGNDVFVSLPTGFGKSLRYAALPYAFDQLRATARQSIVIVVSPLIALYSAKGLKVGGITGATLEVKSQVVKGNFQIVYFSPESLLSGHRWRELLQVEQYRSNVVAFIVDEAHCVKKW